ncbi:MAG: hypothetical protein ACM3WV_11760 [Bacillota bacterium]
MEEKRTLEPAGAGEWDQWWAKVRTLAVKFRLFVGVIVLGLIFLWWGGGVAPAPDNEDPDDVKGGSNCTGSLPALEKIWEERMRDSLSNIEGIGQVVVDITLANSGRQIWKENERQNIRRTEESQTGVKRITTEEEKQREVVMVDSGGSEKPLLEEETAPEIQGVLVIAQGAEIYEVKWQILEAVAALTGLPAHRIIVLPMKR